MNSVVMERYAVGPLADGVPFGATVTGLRREHLNDEAVRKALFDLWIDKGVLLFRDGDHTSEMQIELSRCFGEIARQVFKETWLEGNPDLVKVKYYPDDGSCYDVDGVRLGGYLAWHKDRIYTDSLNRGGILRPIQLSEHGGETGYLDQISAYDSLPEALKARIDGLHVVYAMDLNFENHKFLRPDNIRFVRGAKSFLSISDREYQYPRVLHPMVYTQAETGRKVLNVSPSFATGIYEIGGPEGDALLREVLAHCTAAGNTYFHAWLPDDMVLWDNWRTLHSSTGVPEQETRVMQRTTISGDYSLGRNLEGGEGLPKFDV